MGDYLNFDVRSEDGNQYDDDDNSQGTFETRTGSEISLDDFERDLKKQRENKAKHDQLLDDKYDTILRFNKGDIDPSIYMRKINKINKELDELDFEDIHINEEIARYEMIFSTMLRKLNNKIRTIRQTKSNKNLSKDFLETYELSRLKAIKQILEKLRAVGTEDEEQ